MDTDKYQLLTKVAHLYFIEDVKQEEIAKELNIHRTTVSRMLKEAREKNIVDIRIKDFDSETFKLEQKAKNIFDLNFLEVVPIKKNKSIGEVNNLIGRRASILIRRLINDGDRIGISWGTSLAATVENLEPKNVNDAAFIPLVGGSTQIDASNHVNTLVYELARNFEGSNLYVNASVIQESTEIANGIIEAQYFKELRSNWENLDKVVVGVGGELGIQDSSWRDFLSDKDKKLLSDKNVIGDCCCRFFDQYGNIVKGDLYNRTIGIELEKLKEIPISLAIAAGDDKALAIFVLLKNGYINSLVTDQLTLRKILQYAEKTY